jgi:hypothetical protein
VVADPVLLKRCMGHVDIRLTKLLPSDEPLSFELQVSEPRDVVQFCRADFWSTTHSLPLASHSC